MSTQQTFAPTRASSEGTGDESEATRTASGLGHGDEVDSELTVSDAAVSESDNALSTLVAWDEGGSASEHSDDVKPQRSSSDSPGEDVEIRRGSKRLTARQLARQERLDRGIQQTQWNDLELPRGLDYSTKAKSRDELTEEQQLKKLKEAERRRLKMQKLRKENVENRKARIRASTSSRFKDDIEKQKSDKMKRRCEALAPGIVRVRRRLNASCIVLPTEGSLPAHIQPMKFSGYPAPRLHVEVLVNPAVASVSKQVKLGTRVRMKPRNDSQVVCETLDGSIVGATVDSPSALPEEMRVKSIRFDKSMCVKSLTLGG
ncbi:hypothetical protein BSKO_06035 [Bryopsis sp. KO-2023]|nr:hypothetical protein BSKO_06035 [Bryopsis sp. KO-2023]